MDNLLRNRLCWLVCLLFCVGLILAFLPPSIGVKAETSPNCPTPPANIWVNRVRYRPPDGAQYIFPSLETDYLVGALEGEMGPIYSIPYWNNEALRAGAVAIRTWSSYWCRKHTFTGTPYGTIQGVYDTSNAPYYDQEYNPGHSGDTARYSQRVADTNGQYVQYNGITIDAQYRADTGNPTESWEPFGYSYLHSVLDPVTTLPTTGPGFSQIGSHRWVSGLNPTGTNPRWTSYLQVLVHYYTGVHIRDASDNNRILTSYYRWNALSHNVPSTIYQFHSVQIRVQNTGTFTWASDYYISYRWVNLDGSPVTELYTADRTLVNLDPGHDNIYSVIVNAPALSNPRSLRLRWDMLWKPAWSQYGYWFSGLDLGWPTQDVVVYVCRPCQPLPMLMKNYAGW